MAPELQAGARGTIASDMCALGITLYELTFGQYPYSPTPATLQQVFDRHRSSELTFPDPWTANILEG
jgi:serine/threonine protein kinase